jgi:hypothetical protein
MTTNNVSNNIPNQNVAAHSILLSEGSSSSTGLLLTAGQVAIGTTSGDPAGATLSNGTNISITSASGSITINATGMASFTWNDVATGTQAMVANNGYICDNGASLITYTLPATAAEGTLISVAGFSSGGWKIGQNALQNIRFGNQVTTTGTGGSLASSNIGDQVDILCVVANTSWVVRSAIGNLTFV